MLHVTDTRREADDLLRVVDEPPRSAYALPDARAAWYAAGAARVVDVAALRVPCLVGGVGRCASAGDAVPLAESPYALGGRAYKKYFRDAVASAAWTGVTTPRAFDLLAAAAGANASAAYPDSACGFDGVTRRRPVVVRGATVVARPHTAALLLRWSI